MVLPLNFDAELNSKAAAGVLIPVSVLFVQAAERKKSLQKKLGKAVTLNQYEDVNPFTTAF